MGPSGFLNSQPCPSVQHFVTYNVNFPTLLLFPGVISAPISCDSLYPHFWLPSFGDSGLPLYFSYLVDPREVVDFGFFSFFLVTRAGVITSKLLTCMLDWTLEVPACVLHILCLPFCFWKLSLFLSKHNPPPCFRSHPLSATLGSYSSKCPLSLLHPNISPFSSNIAISIQKWCHRS